MTPIFELCDEYVVRWAALDPVAYAGTHDAVVAAYGDGPLAGELARAAAAAHAGYAETAYKLGERAWLAARDEARRRPGFDLKAWHTAALDLGPIGLAGLDDALRRIGWSAAPPTAIRDRRNGL
jgi:hypothetical protein